MSVDGLSVYIVNLIKNLPPASLSEFEFTVLLNPDVEWPGLTAAMGRLGLRELRAPIATIGPRRDWDMYRFMRRHGHEFDLVHITSNNYPLSLKGGICTIHDVTFKRWFHRKRGIPGSQWLARLYLSWMTRHCLRHAQAIVAVSDSTRREVEELFAPMPTQAAKLNVIHEGWEHLEEYSSGECGRFPFEDDGFIFFLGSHRVHKNIGGLLEGFRLALDRLPPGKKLVMSGTSVSLSATHADVLRSINAREERAVFTGYVSNACVRRLYRRADAFIFPSLSEGFGLPVLEAFHSGTPLLCSNATSLPEVAGDAALYFDPLDPNAIAEAMVRFYEDPALAQRLVEKGAERLHAFSWKRTAAETVQLYRRCLEQA